MKKKTRIMDKDLQALRRAVEALSNSTSRRMLIANMDFLNSYFIKHPSKDLPEYLRAEILISSGKS